MEFLFGFQRYQYSTTGGSHDTAYLFQDHTRDNKPSDTPTHFSLRECFELRLLLLSFPGHLLVFLVSINKVYEHLTHDRH